MTRITNGGMNYWAAQMLALKSQEPPVLMSEPTPTLAFYSPHGRETSERRDRRGWTAGVEDCGQMRSAHCFIAAEFIPDEKKGHMDVQMLTRRRDGGGWFPIHYRDSWRQTTPDLVEVFGQPPPWR